MAKVNRFSNNTPLLLLGVIIVLGLGFVGALSQRGGQDGPTRKEIPSENQTGLENDPSSVNTIVYGSRGERISLISAINDSGNNNSPVTTLEGAIKFVTPLVDGKHLFYIANTDHGDMGDSFALKEIVPRGGATDGTVRTIYRPSDGYKIDRYVISQDHKWIAWYEMKAEEGDDYTHESDYYRVFKANLDEVVKGKDTLTSTLLFEVKSEDNVQVQLPSIVLNSGAVYFDTIIPSTYALYYGYKDESANVILPVNSYNSNPYLVDQRYLLYTSFEPGNSKLPSTGDTDSTRDQIVNTNIVKTFDLSTNQIVTIAPGDEGEHYKHPVYVSGSPDSKMQIVSEIYKVANVGGRQVLSFSEIQLTTKEADGSFTKKTIINGEGKKVRILDVGELPSGDKTVLVGEEIVFRGNLGTGNGIGPSGYKNRLKSIKVYNLATLQLVSDLSPTASEDLEFISIMPKLPREKIGIQRNIKLSDESVDDRQLKLGTFVPIEPLRTRRNPRAECETEWEKRNYPNYEACEACPVYAYSPDNRKITVTPLTPISKASAVPSLSGDSWSFTADNKGTLTFTDGTYSRIDYDFPRGSVEPPKSGVVLSASNLRSGISKFAYGLGFNTRETEDIVEFFAGQLQDSQYVFFSALPHSDVVKLLAVKVSPQPEAYMSHIFYAKKLSDPSEITPLQPQITPFERKDFTVVVWGSVIE